MWCGEIFGVLVTGGGSILNELETINILRRDVEIERVAVIKFWVDERGSDGEYIRVNKGV